MPLILTGMWYVYLNLFKTDQGTEIEKRMDRRKCFQGMGRWTLLAGMAAIAGILVSRRQVVSDQVCSSDFQCKNCKKLSDCGLPEAAKTRDYGGEG